MILDDYIGSGQYTKCVAEELIKKGIPKSNIIIGTLFISENGSKTLEDTGYTVEYVEKVETALNKLTPKEMKTLRKIETMLGIDERFSLGFNQSANLISLIRTPNNTLPIFSYKNLSKVASAPFERRQNS